MIKFMAIFVIKDQYFDYKFWVKFHFPDFPPTSSIRLSTGMLTLSVNNMKALWASVAAQVVEWHSL